MVSGNQKQNKAGIIGELSIYILPAVFRTSYIWNNGVLDTCLQPYQTSKMELVCKNN